MPRQIFILIIVIILLGATQCQTTLPSQATPSLQPPTATPVLIPPLQPGDGTDLIDRLLEKGVIRVGIRVWPEADFAPPAFRGFSNAATGGALNGFEVDIARHVAENLGLELELVEAYPPVIAAGNWRGEWDIAMASLAPFDQPLPGTLAQNIVYSQPYAYIPMGFLLPITANNELPFSQLSGRRVGVLEHSAYQRLLTPDLTQLTVQNQPLVTQTLTVQPVVVSNLQKAIKDLGQPGGESNGPQIDALFGPIPIFQQAIDSDFPVQLAAQGRSIGVQPLAIAAVPQDGLTVDRLIGEINTVLARLQRQGTLPEIYLRWYDQDFSRPR